MSATLKQKIYEHCYSLLKNKILSLNSLLLELTEGASNDTKSSAGDKHETARSMMQIEQEKVVAQLNDVLLQKTVFEKINPKIKSSTIITGSLVKTNKGYLFLSIALGNFKVEDVQVVSISIKSPLGIKLTGLKANDSAVINGVSYLIENIY